VESLLCRALDAEAKLDDKQKQCMAAQTHVQRLQEQLRSLMAAGGNPVSTQWTTLVICVALS